MALTLESLLAKKEALEQRYCEIYAVPSDFNVHLLRKELNFTQAQFAELIGVSLRTVQSWEQGDRKPSTTARVLLETLDDKARKKVA